MITGIEKNLNKQRNSAIELLRIITMLCVIILHYNNKSMGGAFYYVENGSTNQHILFITECVSISAVNLFILISGYFLYQSDSRKLSKIIELFFQESVIKLFLYFFSILSGGNVFSLRELIESAIPNNYFVVLYATLFIISPYLNSLIKGLNYCNFKKLIITMLLVFSVWTIIIDIGGNLIGMDIRGLSTVGVDGSQKGYTIVNFTLMYILGAFIYRHNNEKERLKKRENTISIIVCFIGVFVLYSWALFENALKLQDITAWNYNNPIVVLIPMFVLKSFLNLKLQSRLINELSKACFTCFLLHSALLRFCGIEKAVGGNPFLLVIHIIIIPCLLYAFSYLFYKLYAVTIGKLVKKISLSFNIVDLEIRIQ